MRVISFIFTVLLYLYVAPVPVVTKGSPLQQRLFSALSKKEIHSALVEWMIRSLKSEERSPDSHVSRKATEVPRVSSVIAGVPAR